MSRQLVITGWRGLTRVREKVVLGEIESVARQTGHENLVLLKHDGTQVALHVSAPGVWRMQIEYRLRRLAAFAAPDLDEVVLDPAQDGAVSSLPTADEIEAPPAEPQEQESLDSAFFDRELGAMPLFADELDGLIVEAEEEAAVESAESGVDAAEPVRLEATKVAPGFLLEPVARESTDHLVHASQEEPVVEKETEPPAQEAVVEIAEPVVEIAESAAAIQESARESKLPAPERPAVSIQESIALNLSQDDLQAIGEDLVSDVAMDPASAETVVLDWLATSAITARVRPDLPSVHSLRIAASPYHLREVYEAAEEESISARPVVPEDRRPIGSMANLRPMSLADLIAQGQPNWTTLADLEENLT